MLKLLAVALALQLVAAYGTRTPPHTPATAARPLALVRRPRPLEKGQQQRHGGLLEPSGELGEALLEI
jgi:hypothetical protein